MEIKMLEVRSDRGVTRPVLIRDGGAALLSYTGYPLTAEAVPFWAAVRRSVRTALSKPP